MDKKASLINNLEEIINNDGVIILPAGTVYGLFCRADSKKAVRRIFRMKSRSIKKPLQVFLSSPDEIKKYAVIPRGKIKEIKSLLPGPYTIILKARKKLPAFAGSESAGIRVVKNPLINSLIKKIRAPLAATSANISGKKTPVKFRDIPAGLVERAGYALKKDSLNSGRPSVIIDLRGETKVTVR